MATLIWDNQDNELIKKLVTDVQCTFTRLTTALKSRELQLLRQVDVILQQYNSNHHKSKYFDRIKVSFDSEIDILKSISNFGSIDFEGVALNTNIYKIEDYENPTSDHVCLRKCLKLGTPTGKYGSAIDKFGTPTDSLGGPKNDSFVENITFERPEKDTSKYNNGSVNNTSSEQFFSNDNYNDNFRKLTDENTINSPIWKNYYAQNLQEMSPIQYLNDRKNDLIPMQYSNEIVVASLTANENSTQSLFESTTKNMNHHNQLQIKPVDKNINSVTNTKITNVLPAESLVSSETNIISKSLESEISNSKKPKVNTVEYLKATCESDSFLDLSNPNVKNHTNNCITDTNDTQIGKGNGVKNTSNSESHCFNSDRDLNQSEPENFKLHDQWFRGSHMSICEFDSYNDSREGVSLSESFFEDFNKNVSQMSLNLLDCSRNSSDLSDCKLFDYKSFNLNTSNSQMQTKDCKNNNSKNDYQNCDSKLLEDKSEDIISNKVVVNLNDTNSNVSDCNTMDYKSTESGTADFKLCKNSNDNVLSIVRKISAEHSTQVQQWVKQLINESETEPVQNDDILEHVNIQTDA